MDSEKWNNGEVVDVLPEFFKVKNRKVQITLPVLNRLLMDPRCPEPQRSNLIEYLVKMRHRMVQRQKMMDGDFVS